MIKILILIAASFTAIASHAEPLRFSVNTTNCTEERAFAVDLKNLLKEPILKAFHEILMSNELNQSCGALQFTDAAMSSNTNGFSFGPSQFDLATRSPQSMSDLKDIVTCAENELGHQLLSKPDLAFLTTQGQLATAKLKQDQATWQRFGQLRAPIEMALKSNCGKKILADKYVKELNGFLPHANQLWNAALAGNPDLLPAKQFFLLYALDYKNLLNGANGFLNYIRDRKNVVCYRLCENNVVPPFEIQENVILTDFFRYTFQATCYGFVAEPTRQFDALRRLNRVLGSVDLGALPPLTDKDKNYLKGEFANMVASAKSASPKLDVTQLQALIKMANNGAALAGISTVINQTSLALHRSICTEKK